MEYKVGDKIQVIGHLSEYEWIRQGIITNGGTEDVWRQLYCNKYFIISEVYINSIEINLDGGFWSINKDMIVKVEKGEKNMNESSSKWSFDTLSLDSIDYNKIMSELSIDNPIAFMESNSKTYDEIEDCVVICDDFIQMAQFKNVPIPTDYIYDKAEGYGGMIIVLNNKNGYGQFINWVREVRIAEWLDKNKATITLTIPKI